MNLKKGIRKLHLWLGLLTGSIVFIVAITGCIYAFQQEISDLVEEYRFVTPQDEAFLPPSVLKEIGQNQLPNKHMHAIQYLGKDKAAEVIFYDDEPLYYDICYVNPYTGEVQKTVNVLSGFFRFILDGHFYLWLPHEIGQTIIASSTLIFVLIIISGFILWYPKNRKAAKQRFWFRWKDTTKWKRKNYDLHNITGFYVMSIALIFAITGLVWGFPWFGYGYYKLLGGEKSVVYEDPVVENALNIHENATPLDKVYYFMTNEYKDAVSIEVHIPHDKTTAIAANANLDEGTYWKADYRYFDPVTFEEINVNHLWGRLHDTNIADTLVRMNYDIHVGAVLGLPGKIFAFLISLLIATLPITGFLVWWGRNKKKTLNP